MPLFVVYPVELDVLKQILDVLGEPRDVEVEVSVEDERLRDVFELGEVDCLTVVCHCKPTVEETLELYREYYEGYVSRIEGRVHVEERSRAILSLKVSWYIDGLSAEFDGFKLKLGVRGGLKKAVEILKLLRERCISIEVDLSGREPDIRGG